MITEHSYAEGRNRYREKQEASAALAQMQAHPPEGDAFARRYGMRPLKPPPLPETRSRVRTAGQLALANEVRMGLVTPPTRWAP